MVTKRYFSGIVFTLVMIIFLPEYSRAQSDSYIKDVSGKSEISVTVGANNFLGDLGGNLGKGGPAFKDYTFKTIRPLGGISFAYYPKNWYQIRVGLNYTSVDGADSLIKPTTDLARWRIYRNLSFNSHIFEGCITGQFYPLTLFSASRDVQRLTPFAEIGIGVFHFNPTAVLNGQVVDLQPLRLEGEGFSEMPNSKVYSLTQFYIPASIGVKYYLNDEFSFSLGANFRKTFTDYIDDVSQDYPDPSLFAKYLSPTQAALATQLYKRVKPQYETKVGMVRGNPNNDDSYVDFFFTISVTIQRFINFYYGGHDYNRDGQLMR